MMKSILALSVFSIAFTALPLSTRADDGFRRLPGNTYVRDYDYIEPRNDGNYRRLPGNTYIRNDNDGNRRAFRLNGDDDVVIYNTGYGRRGYGYGPRGVGSVCAGVGDRGDYRDCMEDAAEAQEELRDKYD